MEYSLNLHSALADLCRWSVLYRTCKFCFRL